MTTTRLRTCPLCEATCGLVLEVDDDRIGRVTGDDQHPLSGGYLCPKGAAFGELDADPDRLTRPRIRSGDDWRDVDWDEAFAFIDDRLRYVDDTHGRDSVALYLGNPNVHTLAGQLYTRPFRQALRPGMFVTASTVDQMPKHRACGEMFGDPAAIPVPDIDRTDLLLVFGADPMMSNGSVWTVPDIPGRLRALRKRGGRLVVVDPRRSRTAARADLHLPIRPTTDAILLAAMVTVLFQEGPGRPGPPGAARERAWTTFAGTGVGDPGGCGRRPVASRWSRSGRWRATWPPPITRSSMGGSGPPRRPTARWRAGWWTCSTS
jgi:anaerobic selenocysteine-containing dehydrogenase